VKLDRRPAEPSPQPPARRSSLSHPLALLFLLLMCANLGALLTLPSRLSPAAEPRAADGRPEVAKSAGKERGEANREDFAQALHRLLLRQSGSDEWKKLAPQLQRRYQALAARDGDLRVDSPEGRALVAAVVVLGRRGSDQVEELVREALTSRKVYSDEVIELICRHVRERLADAVRKGP
jgi:hypothetical protein